MSAKLLCLKGPYAGQEFPVEGHGIVLGRDPAMASVILDDSSVSRSHANVFLSQDGRVILQDLRSTNGTFLIDSSGSRAKVQGDVILADGQRFSLGTNDDNVFEIRCFGQTAQSEASDVSEWTRAGIGEPASPAAEPPGPELPGSSPVSYAAGEATEKEAAPDAIVEDIPRTAPVYSSEGYKDNFWVGGLRSWGYFLFIIILIAGITTGYSTTQWMWGSNSGGAIIAFLIAFLPFAIGGFLLVAFMMLFVEMASDIGKIRYMLGKRRN